MKQLALVFLILISSPSFVLTGRIPTIPAGHRTQYLLLRPDGGYSSGYDTGLGHVAVAQGDARNEVVGAFAGGPLRVSYSAGVRGYIPTVEVQTPPTPRAALPPPPPPPPPPTPPPPPPPQHPFIPIETADARVLHNPDGSYAFSYRTSDQSREEIADSQNNVRGSFSFVPPDDGIRRRVNYQAGAETGFVAQGAHLPTAPQTQSAVTDQTLPTLPAPPPPPPPPSTPIETADARVLHNPDGSYAFSYRTSDQSREESADAQNNVRGSFSFVPPDDGIRRRVNYQAGAETGFVAQGAHLPTAPQTQSTVSDQTLPTLPAPPPPPPPPSTPIETADARVVHNPDGSYAFSYQTSDHSREEIADSQNNVRGSFSFVPPDDGIRRTVNYQAGAETGFVAQGAHLPTGPQTQTTESDQTQPTTDTEEPQTDDGSTTPPIDASGNNDASYVFAYRTQDQERVESSDRTGNVRGLFSFVAPDGVRRRVDYEAGANKGFIARGNHLPTPPPIPSGVTPTVGLQPITPASLPPPNANVWNSGAGAWNSGTGTWNAAGSWPVTVPDPLRVDTNLGDVVVRNYLPSHPRKAGYVMDIE